MMTTPAYPANPQLDDNRWDWAWNGEKPRFILTDSINARQSSVLYLDPATMAESLLPFKAYELNAIAFDTGGTIRARRQALIQADALHRAIGTERGYYILIELVGATGTHQYVTGTPGSTTIPRVYGVHLHVTPPIDRVGDTEFLRFITDRARRTWPYTIAVLSVNILAVAATTIYVAAATDRLAYTGFPNGV